MLTLILFYNVEQLNNEKSLYIEIPDKKIHYENTNYENSIIQVYIDIELKKEFKVDLKRFLMFDLRLLILPDIPFFNEFFKDNRIQLKGNELKNFLKDNKIKEILAEKKLEKVGNIKKVYRFDKDFFNIKEGEVNPMKLDLLSNYLVLDEQGNFDLREYTFDNTTKKAVHGQLKYFSTIINGFKDQHKILIEQKSVRYIFISDPNSSLLYSGMTTEGIEDYFSNLKLTVTGLFYAFFANKKIKNKIKTIDTDLIDEIYYNRIHVIFRLVSNRLGKFNIKNINKIIIELENNLLILNAISRTQTQFTYLSLITDKQEDALLDT